MLAAVEFWLASYGRAALILGIALCIGYPVCRRILRGPASPLLTLMVGMALLGLLVSTLAWLRIFRGVSVTIVGVAAAGLSLHYVRKDLPGWRRRLRATWPPSTAMIAAFTVLVGALVFYSVLALYPVTAFDATSYHLPLARDLVQNHGLVYDPFVRYSFFPQANESMFAVMLLMSKSSSSSGALEFAMLAVSVVALSLWFIGSGRSIAAGLTGGLIVLASPVLILAGTVPYVDVWTMDFVLGGLLIGLEVAEGRISPVPGLALSGLLLGEAAATKYLAIGFAIAAALGIWIAASRSKVSWRASAAGAGAFLLIALPWYAWTVHTTGNPLYPWITGVFGNRHGLWTSAEINAQRSTRCRISSLDCTPTSSTFWAPAVRNRNRAFTAQLVARRRLPGAVVPFAATLPDIPRRDAGRPVEHRHDGRDLFQSPLLHRRGRTPLPQRGIGRRLGISGMGEFAPGPLARPPSGPVLVLGSAFVVLFSSSRWERGVLRGRGPPPTTASEVSEYLRSAVPCYAAVDYLNTYAGSHYRAWSYSCEQNHYYARGRLIGDEFSVGSRHRIFDDNGLTLPGYQTLWRRLAPLHVQWMILPVTMSPTQDCSRHTGCSSLWRPSTRWTSSGCEEAERKAFGNLSVD